ncbi:Phosphotransferase enzyme family protein [Pseudooceanicola antarcticus]|uniref:Aminoglycoside phosphotransferase family protein n=1 Tax=Pseudooceanicola antarcticus TaxID=1247613 RepID=A0A285HQA3_9RHOB|nr:phosphotransferase [Pseudooceanicola antarcticus]PJE27668.1 aminoglycoside phosphotransferase family protein [Pseudooceanicola antarcticus]SNY37950.1 Phosphotransferase enzyme family protein [Pseudooceanicola antarcticus]
MNALLENAAELHPEAAAQAARRLAAVLAARGGEAGEILHLVPGRRAVFAGSWQGAEVVFHLALDPEQARAFASGFAEQTRVHGYMGQGAFRVPEPLALLEGGELTAVARIEGQPLLQAMWQAEAGERPALQALGAGWLAAHAAPTLETSPVNRGPWRKWADKGLEQQPHEALRGIETRVAQKFHALSRRMRGQETWRTALGHGDFHPNNLMLDGAGLCWGIDLGASTRAPLCRDIARYLVHGARRGMLPSGQMRYGVDAGGLQAFAQAFSLTDQELATDLPFFICHEVLSRVEHPQMPGRRIRLTQEMTEALFEDMRALMKD